MAKDKKIEVVCAWCGKMKKVKPYTYHRNQRFFCDGSTGNSDCRRAWESEFKTGKDNNNYKKKVKVLCANCGTEKHVKPSRFEKSETKHFYCDANCQGEWMKRNNKPEESNLWKGGVKGLDVPLYDTYANQISYAIDVRRGMENNKYLEVKCSFCDKWHVPSLAYLRRVLSIFKRENTHLQIYCSDECKTSCPVFGMRKYPKGFRPINERQEIVDPETRILTLNRDSYQCQKCGATEDLDVHHIEGVMQEPMLANDLDNCMTVCHSCHAEIHSQPGCTFFDYRRESCEHIAKEAVSQ